MTVAGTSAIAAVWAANTEAAKTSELLTTSPSTNKGVPVMEVPGETPTSPPRIVVKTPGKVMAVPAWIA